MTPMPRGSAPSDSHSRLPAEREQAMYGIVLDILKDVGYEALSMDAVSTQAHISKATLYRRWGSKSALVVASIRHERPSDPGAIDTGTLRGDLHEVARQLSAQSRDTGALMSAVIHAMRHDAELEHTMRSTFIEGQQEGVRRIASRAVERGEVAADAPALPHFPQLIMGAFAVRHLLEAREVDPEYLIDYFDDVVLPALGVREI